MTPTTATVALVASTTNYNLVICGEHHVAFVRSCGPDWLDAMLTASEILIVDGAMGIYAPLPGYQFRREMLKAVRVDNGPGPRSKVDACD